MDADIRLDGNLTTIEGDFVKTTAVDVVIDNPGRRRVRVATVGPWSTTSTTV